MKFNINHYVRVRLTDHGLNIYRRRQEELQRQFNERGCAVGVSTEPKTDADGWSRWQMWNLMETFGSYCGLGRLTPFETEIEIESEAKP